MIFDVVLSVITGLAHRLVRRHWPRWARMRYDGMGWDYECLSCPEVAR